MAVDRKLLSLGSFGAGGVVPGAWGPEDFQVPWERRDVIRSPQGNATPTKGPPLLFHICFYLYSLSSVDTLFPGKVKLHTRLFRRVPPPPLPPGSPSWKISRDSFHLVLVLVHSHAHTHMRARTHAHTFARAQLALHTHMHSNPFTNAHPRTPPRYPPPMQVHLHTHHTLPARVLTPTHHHTLTCAP